MANILDFSSSSDVFSDIWLDIWLASEYTSTILVFPLPFLVKQ